MHMHTYILIHMVCMYFSCIIEKMAHFVCIYVCMWIAAPQLGATANDLNIGTRIHCCRNYEFWMGCKLGD